MVKIKKGIDISEWQGKLNYDNFNSIKSSGIEFIIIRCGYTSYGKSKKKYKDKYFENNYSLAKQLSIPVGTYYYSCATNEEEAKEEANFILDLIKDKEFEYPICIDTEDNHNIYNSKYSNESQYSIGKEKLTSVIKIICEIIESKKNYVSIYASTSWFKNNLILNDLTNIDKWIAQWSNTVNFSYKYGMWQYSSSGNIKGINGKVDLDYSYKDYPEIIINGGFNGYIKSNEKNKDLDKKTVIDEKNSNAVDPIDKDENLSKPDIQKEDPTLEKPSKEDKNDITEKEISKENKKENKLNLFKKIFEKIYNFLNKLLTLLIKIIK